MTKRTFCTLLMSAGLIGGILAGSATPLLAADKEIKIGGLFPMSGPGSYFGAQDKQGVELALEQLNKTGVNGYKFEVKYEDFLAARSRQLKLPNVCSISSNLMS